MNTPAETPQNEVPQENGENSTEQTEAEPPAPPVPVIPAEVEKENWVLVVGGIVTEKRPYKQDESYILAPEDVVPGFVFQDGEFTAPSPSHEDLWLEIRRKRDALLSACDWTMLTDAPVSESVRNDWGVYRQMLRELPNNYSDPNDVVFPDAPGA